MSMIKHLVRQCPFCHQTAVPNWKVVNVWKCLSCGLLFRDPLPSYDDLVQLYRESWSDPHEHRAETGGTDIGLARAYARKLACSLSLRDFCGLKLLDFGAGRGAMLTALKELGADVYAIEPFGYEYLRRHGFVAFSTLDEVPEELTFDGIVAIDVIEHLHAPWNEIKQFKNYIKDSGWVYMATLNASGLNAMVFRSNWREVLKMGHLMFFTPFNLEVILANSGYRQYRRLKWFIQYRRNPIRRLLHSILQNLHLDGELRYLGWKK